MTHKTPVHVPACGLILSGHLPLSSITHPCLGSVVAKELGPRNELPAFVSVPGSTGYWEESRLSGAAIQSVRPAIRIRRSFRCVISNCRLGVDWARMDRRRSLLKLADDKFRKYDSQNLIENMNSYYQTAFGLMQSERAKKAFLIGEEPEKLRDAYGRTSSGQGALLAADLWRQAFAM